MKEDEDEEAPKIVRYGTTIYITWFRLLRIGSGGGNGEVIKPLKVQLMFPLSPAHGAYFIYSANNFAFLVHIRVCLHM